MVLHRSSIKTTNRAIHTLLGPILHRVWGMPGRIPSRNMRNDPSSRSPFFLVTFVCLWGFQSGFGSHLTNRKQIDSHCCSGCIGMNELPPTFWPLYGNSDRETVFHSSIFSICLWIRILMTLSEGCAVISTLLFCSLKLY